MSRAKASKTIDARAKRITDLKASRTDEVNEAIENFLFGGEVKTEDSFDQAVPLGLIHPSPNNPRKSFDKEKIAELAEDLKLHGMIEPVILRVAADGYELIAGERRIRAAKIAGLQTVPAIIKSLTDAEADEIRLVENLQREDLSAVEEADGLKLLAERHNLSPDDLAARIGKSKRHVYQRLQLCTLGPDARKAVARGELSASVATLVARVPDGVKQKEFLAEVVKPKFQDEPLSYRDASKKLTDGYQITLGKAQFKTTDETLTNAGSCKTCPKNTSNIPEEVRGGANVCTDISCFAMKQEAHFFRLGAEHQSKGKVLSKAETAKVFHSYGLNYNSGYVDIDSGSYHSLIGTQTWRKALGKDLPADLTLAFANGRIYWLGEEKKLAKLYKTFHPETKKTFDDKPTRSSSTFAKEQAERERKRKIGQAVERSAIGEIVARIEADDFVEADLLRCLVKARIEFFDGDDRVPAIVERRGLFADDPTLAEMERFEREEALKEKLTAYVGEMDYLPLLGLLLEMEIADAYGAWSDDFSESFKGACALFAIPLDEYVKQAKEAEKAEAKSKGRAKK